MGTNIKPHPGQILFLDYSYIAFTFQFHLSDAPNEQWKVCFHPALMRSVTSALPWRRKARYEAPPKPFFAGYTSTAPKPSNHIPNRLRGRLAVHGQKSSARSRCNFLGLSPARTKGSTKALNPPPQGHP